ncbi:hypothetical protein TGME49_229190 [Toxoplasma gondii ME49]|uniref:Uncharacterized protein n=2 Tax=Toxoplasma gondii TaxID=5811 RepID=B6KJ40_TOXGV|nr:hypothetical protein TGME49_229190 [Toxoplasma gondii ME49]EPT29113.1 hypothetical protein TGME49_229190 [Toxoplasma gondii ME49]ESS35526.1 hypothetical protein TGVEG_229190 [Toxoplasma gondii VEG]|eukprot:XP_002367863.1 hypothetical protein TGME49_229190 [Toxoplasma gondii ME49]
METHQLLQHATQLWTGSRTLGPARVAFRANSPSPSSVSARDTSRLGRLLSRTRPATEAKTFKTRDRSLSDEQADGEKKTDGEKKADGEEKKADGEEKKADGEKKTDGEKKDDEEKREEVRNK